MNIYRIILHFHIVLLLTFFSNSQQVALYAYCNHTGCHHSIKPLSLKNVLKLKPELAQLTVSKQDHKKEQIKTRYIVSDVFTTSSIVLSLVKAPVYTDIKTFVDSHPDFCSYSQLTAKLRGPPGCSILS